ncbi:MAG: hypothetical protein A3A94_01915 [Candidatus Portnoybacteria bacterium RIFCSPLOWO2_01_FULL_43_11]|uniref:Peptidase C39-like domain-containing protein n=3 Tax=Bacteria candidate phyla TaxID=1783234 RepID=A0A1G2FMK7_9BACT|nr:MAG: hypothetical protein A2713_01060 [candidate division WWE3 bacterium RIFCSPHIGHO2_01_FULL_35_17]OGZ36535.1 MAG: hypothetical protein A3D38_01040 [Candidatus Portnoybacteria bacterium RIFCSPHIGHO2_02_FULL_40_23]OGZ39059.1 MAG: hypothetical protein A3A94_01915 [Candidatus Portnoybacteria bacterium RIFCSPLOWO2_01_FULL_43_11]OGZ39336.1 MAG: hypothetical protein A3E90_01240 [Candidatus Portnoybacteria bacterium RIFCSPHIGHO2_12_FULL_40_11]
MFFRFYKIFLILFSVFVGGMIIIFILFPDKFNNPQLEIQNTDKFSEIENQYQPLVSDIMSETEAIENPILPITEEKENLPDNPPIQNILLEVPFTSQAPSGNWQDIIFQNACEEASILMAMSWVRGETLTKEEAEKEIKAISDFELKTYGDFHDRSAADTAQLIRDYFDYDNIEVMENISASDIKTELTEGNLVIVPVNGQKMNNPFYTPPGPIEHMLVIIGYDTQTKEFITNDSGTKRGEKYRYSESILEAALKDYKTGFHEPLEEIKKVMIVVK